MFGMRQSAGSVPTRFILTVDSFAMIDNLGHHGVHVRTGFSSKVLISGERSVLGLSLEHSPQGGFVTTLIFPGDRCCSILL